MIRIAEPLPDDDGQNESRDRLEHRHYDPTVGRWLSEEPISFAECNVPRYVGDLPIAASGGR